MYQNNLGKLKNTLGEKCPQCGKNLQTRTRSKLTVQFGEEVYFSEEYVCCSDYNNCDYERKEKRNKKHMRDKRKESDDEW